jgi:hypothetical protein
MELNDLEWDLVGFSEWDLTGFSGIKYVMAFNGGI